VTQAVRCHPDPAAPAAATARMPPAAGRAAPAATASVRLPRCPVARGMKCRVRSPDRDRAAYPGLPTPENQVAGRRVASSFPASNASCPESAAATGQAVADCPVLEPERWARPARK
jgi:hypothetical protein